MQAKQSREELQRAIAESQAVERLPRPSLEEICRIFRVEDPTNDPTVLTRLLRNKVLDILCEEGPAFMDYLHLPKFRPLPAEHTQRMHALFQTAWARHIHNHHQRLSQQAAQQLHLLLPVHSSPAEQEAFHLGVLQLYRQSPFCPASKPLPPLPAEPLPAFLAPQLPQQPIMFSFLNYPVPKLEQPEGSPYLMENKPMFELNHFALPQNYFPLEPTRTDIKPHCPISFHSNLEDIADRFLSYKFIQCRCEGEIADDRSAFSCTLCQYWYHADCLFLNLNPDRALCPLCMLRKESVFCKVQQEPIRFNWHLRNPNEFKVTLSEEESQAIYSAHTKGLKSQIRFLKIDGKSLRKDRLQTNTAINRSIKHTEITLPDPQPNNPISLQILMRTSEDQQPKLYFYAVFLIEVRKVEDIVRQVFSGEDFTRFDYYLPWLAREGRVTLSLVEETFTHGHIRYPVRGLHCDHLEVFDLRGYLTLVNELKRDTETELTCPLCSRLCPSFRYDQFLYGLIQNSPNYDQQRPTAVEITLDGQHSWVNEVVQPSPAESSSSSMMGE